MQWLLEGPAIEPLLQRVREEHGPDVRIVRAERVRVGGFIGFFAKEQFEVTIEVDDAGGASAPGAATAGAPRSAASRPTTGQGARELTSVRSDPSLTIPGMAGAGAAAPSGATVAGLEGLLAQAELAEQAGVPAAMASAFQSVLTSVQQGQAGGQVLGGQVLTAPVAPAAPAVGSAQQPDRSPSSAIIPAQAVRPAAAAPAELAPTPPAPPAPAVLVLPQTPLLAPQEVPAAPVAPSPVLPAPALAGPQLVAPAVPPAPLAPPAPQGADETVTVVLPAATPPSPHEPLPFESLSLLSTRAAAPAAPAPAAPLAPVKRSFAPLPATTGSLAAIPGQRSSSGQPAPMTRREARRREGTTLTRPRTAADGDHLAERLAALGVPREWLEELPLARSEALRHVTECISAIPAQSRRRPTAADPVVVVLADLDAALPVARQLAVGLGLDDGEVVALHRKAPGVLRDRCLSGRAELVAEVRRARERQRALVVVLPAPVGAPAAAVGALADTLAVTEPDEVWAVVDATRRLEDNSAWLSGLTGDRGVDAVALVNADATVAPAAALGLPAPVVLLGDEPATPRSWASLLGARLAAQDLG